MIVMYLAGLPNRIPRGQSNREGSFAEACALPPHQGGSTNCRGSMKKTLAPGGTTPIGASAFLPKVTTSVGGDMAYSQNTRILENS
jgi:hypothetical protein